MINVCSNHIKNKQIFKKLSLNKMKEKPWKPKDSSQYPLVTS